MIDIVMDEAAWFAVCFLIFVILAFAPAKKAIIGFLDGKIKNIQDQLNEAQRAKIQAEEENAQLRAQIDLSDKHHKEMFDKASLEIESIYNERCAAFKHTIEYRAKALESSLEQMKLDAASAIEGAFLDLVVDAVEVRMTKNASGKIDVQILKNAS
jgi:F-type H+-transporting ATPase subunit b